ncbi:hypothetical protein LMJ53_05160 [Rheinheimera sp. UJ51]|uniref:phenylacetate--CoA ligase family protein n=1 Tax=Rheinheimera sp. UJ51 TaxID=2892446 RepID=UPI001E584717|nr:hypothetical protein [Rheinheimera sp. UJ51]MCC5451125.1 hypothetical protein [Rheinheimera sp. UJ51]
MLYQKIFFNVLYPFYEGIIKRRKTFSYYRKYMQNETVSRDELKVQQLKALKDLLEHCYSNVAYYRSKWDELGFKPSDIQTVADLEKIPLLTKSIIRENYDQLRASTHEGINITKTSGGSTGAPFKFEHDRENYNRRQGVIWRGYGWSGSKTGDKTLYFWGTPVGSLLKGHKIKDALYNWFYNRKILNVFSMSKDNIQTYVDAVNDFKPDGIVAYTGPLYEIAKYIVDNNVQVAKVKWLIVGAEPLFDVQREVIEKAFSAPLFNTYGCREFTLIAAECKEKTGLHINDDHLVVEITDDSGLATKDVGNIVITDLYNYGMPLVRYVNGDIAKLKDNPCPCGLPFSQLSYIDGRRLDKIVTKSGNLLPGEFFIYILKDVVGIDKFQVIQNAVSEIDLKIIKTEKYDANFAETYVNQCLIDTVGDELLVNFYYVDDIALTVSGKHRVTVSNIVESL